MIVGTGIDIIEVDRIAEKLLKGDAFKKKIFSASEIEYCDRLPNAAQHYAARFAMKEAFLKAVGLGLLLDHSLSDIEVIHDERGRPLMKLSGAFQKYFDEQGWRSVHVSLSHVQSMACAVVIIEK